MLVRYWDKFFCATIASIFAFCALYLLRSGTVFLMFVMPSGHRRFGSQLRRKPRTVDILLTLNRTGFLVGRMNYFWNTCTFKREAYVRNMCTCESEASRFGKIYYKKNKNWSRREKLLLLELDTFVETCLIKFNYIRN